MRRPTRECLLSLDEGEQVRLLTARRCLNRPCGGTNHLEHYFWMGEHRHMAAGDLVSLLRPGEVAPELKALRPMQQLIISVRVSAATARALIPYVHRYVRDGGPLLLRSPQKTSGRP